MAKVVVRVKVGAGQEVVVVVWPERWGDGSGDGEGREGNGGEMLRARGGGGIYVDGGIMLLGK